MKRKEEIALANKLDEITRNEPRVVTVAGKTYKIYRVSNIVWAWYSRLVTKTELGYSDDKDKILINMENNRTLIFKCVAMMLLRNPIKVFLFNWIYWRYLYVTRTVIEMAYLLTEINSLSDVSEVFFCSDFLQANNQLLVMMAKESTSAIQAKHSSAKDTTPSQPSTVG